jgi:hypothetical protein
LKKSESRTRAEAGFEEPPIFAELVWPRHSGTELSTPKPTVLRLKNGHWIESSVRSSDADQAGYLAVILDQDAAGVVIRLRFASASTAATVEGHIAASP